MPDDVTHTTVEIVTKIRCEARDAVVAEIADYLIRSKSEINKSFGAALKDNHGLVVNIENHIDDTAFSYLSSYYQGSIGYEFKMDMTEQNNRSIGLNFFNPFSNGERTLTIGGGVDRQNKNSRNFQIVDTFENLRALYPDAQQDREDYCSKIAVGDQLYPITGRIGLQEVVHTFVALNDAAKIEPAKPGDTLATFADTIEFQTILTGNVNPKIELVPVNSGVGLANAGMTNTFKRIDTHSVVIAIKLPTNVKASPRGQGEKTPTRRRSGDRTRTSASDATRQGVLDELDRQSGLKTLNEIKRRVEQDY